MASSTDPRKIAHVLDIDRTEDVKTVEDITFDGLLLSKETMEGLKQCGFVKPSPIQIHAIPLGKCGFDLIVEAKSGTGKTAVFSIIALESIRLDLDCQCVIIVPTREIAFQTQQVIVSLGVGIKGLSVELVIGGTNVDEDIKRLQNHKYQILIGTPGRLKHLINEKVIDLSVARLLILDEADNLMENSCQKDVNFIFSKLPERKQVIAVSATYTPELSSFLLNYMRSASHINPYNSRILLGVSQYMSVIKSHFNKFRQNELILSELKRIVSIVQFKQCLIFCNYQATTRNTWKFLRENGWPVEYLASSQTQQNRLKSLDKLQSFQCRILVATDLAARGIDASNVDLIINLENPYDCATYLHRIGRCGRYGAKGNAITVLPDKDVYKFQQLLKSCGDSFDIKPFEESFFEVKDNIEIKLESNLDQALLDETIQCTDLMPLFQDDKKNVDHILNLFIQDYNADPENVTDFNKYFELLPARKSNEIPEFDHINHLKKTVPDFDKLSKYIERTFIEDDDVSLIDRNGNLKPFMEAEIVTNNDAFEIVANYSGASNSFQSESQSSDSSDNNLTLSDSSENCNDEYDISEDYWRWRERLSLTTSYIQQNVYLQTIAELNGMNIDES